MNERCYVGLDQHKHYSYVTVLTSQGQEVKKGMIYHSKAALSRWVREFKDQKATVALEATGFWPWMADFLESHGLEVHLAHPLKVKPFAEKHLKTDRVDSLVLAQLLRLDYLPEAYLAPQEVRKRRELLRFRAFVVSLRTQLKNKVHSYLHAWGLLMPCQAPRRFSAAGCQWLKTLQINGQTEQLIGESLKLIEVCDQVIAQVDRKLEQVGEEDERLELLEQIPGIGKYLGGLIVAEIGEIQRFRRARQLVSYAGLNPAVWSSGGKMRYGRITKYGSPWLRWAFTEAAIHAERKVEQWRASGARLRARKGVSAARMEVARKICRAVFHMLSQQMNFKEYLQGKTNRTPVGSWNP